MMTKNLLRVALIASIFMQSVFAMEAPAAAREEVKIKDTDLVSAEPTLVGIPAELKLRLLKVLSNFEYQSQGGDAIKSLGATCKAWRKFIDDYFNEILEFLGNNPRFKHWDARYLTMGEASWAAANLRTCAAFEYLKNQLLGATECALQQTLGITRNTELFIKMHDFLMMVYHEKKNHLLTRVRYSHYSDEKEPKNLITRLELVLTYGLSVEHIARYIHALCDYNAASAEFIHNPTVQRMILYSLAVLSPKYRGGTMTWEIETEAAKEYESWLKKIRQERSAARP